MTAGRSAGTEQGQGREVPMCSCHPAPQGVWLGVEGPWHANPQCALSTAPPVPPARDSGNGGALGQVTASRNAQSGRDEAPIDSPLIAGHAATNDQSGRDEAREAVARELGRHQGLRGPMDDERPDVWQNRCECGWDDGDEHPGWRERYRMHIAGSIFDLPQLAALLRDGTTT